jgi:acetylornithine deacetylase/succinyl-diaminopimelate desuccinylase
VFGAIDRSGWEVLLRDLVCTPSHPGVPRQEEAAVAVLGSWLRDRGVLVVTQEVAPGRPNLTASLRGTGPGRRLVLCGHTDTVPLNAGEPGVGFSAEVRDGRLHGRGSVDMKGALAAMAGALAGLAAAGALPAGEVVLAAVADEEMQSLGAEALVAGGFRADGAIVGEPTSNRLALGHKGLEWLTLTFRGRAAHGGTPEAGINAIVAAARFVALVEDRLKPRLARRPHPVLGPPTINAGTIAGGDQPSTVAATCTLAVDRRSVPGETFATIVGELNDLLREVERAMPGLATGIDRTAGGMATLEHLATVIPADHALAAAVESARVAVTGRAERPTSFPAWTDASLLSNFARVPCVVLGPGDLALAHSPQESVPLAEVAEAARIYAQAAVGFCPGETAL